MLPCPGLDAEVPEITASQFKVRAIALWGAKSRKHILACREVAAVGVLIDYLVPSP